MDVKKDDGFAALHLAALNGHRDVANTLITMVGTFTACKQSCGKVMFSQVPVSYSVLRGVGLSQHALGLRGRGVDRRSERSPGCC